VAIQRWPPIQIAEYLLIDGSLCDCASALRSSILAHAFPSLPRGSVSVCTTASSGTPLAGGLGWRVIGELLAIHPQAAFEEYANPGRRHRNPGPRSR